jgi:hypothetical protein
MDTSKLGKWLDLSECGHYVDVPIPGNEVGYSRILGSRQRVCGRKPTHAIFLNTPDDTPYIVGSCSEHKNVIGGFPYVTRRKLEKTIEKLISEGCKKKDIAWSVCLELDPPDENPEIQK